MKLSTAARGKLNLTLDVVGKRPDGYHDISSVMQTVSLADGISVVTDTSGWEISCDDPRLPTDESNLAFAAARAFSRKTGISTGGMSITIQKRIPVFAGLGGGSADAGSVLAALNRAYGEPLDENHMIDLALSAGSDVPFCLNGGTALVEGRGEQLRQLSPMPRCWLVLCKPDFDLTAGEMYGRLDRVGVTERPDNLAMETALQCGDVGAISKLFCNVFWPTVESEHPEVVDIKQALLDLGAVGASMTGKGPTMFGLFTNENLAKQAADELKQKYSHTFVAKIE